MKLSKKIAILATALISFAFISCDTDTDDSKPPAESSGSTEAGGSAGTGGSTSSGGSTEAGGTGGTGGSTESGGSAGTGGSAGGSTGTEGSTGSGGSTETGGSAGTGGSTGGSTESGGGTGAGGSTESGGSGETGGSTGSGGESEGNPVLPGIKGGTGNEKDTFAGKTFYDSVEKDTAEYYTKYVFSTDGTVEIRSKDEGETEESSVAVINYSFSEDGKIVYMTYNKFNDMLPGSGKLYTYEEFVQTGNDAIVKFYMDNVFNEKVPEEAKKEYAEILGLEAYTTDDAVRDALKERISNMVRKIFGSVYQYDLSSDAAGPAVLTERITWGTDLSKFISLNGNTYYSYSDGVLEFRFTHSAGEFSCTYVNQNDIDPDDPETLTRWIFRNVDDSKIYFKVKGETKVLGYTIFDDGKKLNLVIDDNPIVAKLKLDEMSLYN